MLVGNKSDLTLDYRVNLEDANEFSASLGIEHAVTSALRRTNVDEALRILAQAIVNRRCYLIQLKEPTPPLEDEPTSPPPPTRCLCWY